MGFILKENIADMIKGKYKNSYFSEKLNLSGTYISLIINRKKTIAKHMAYAFTKAIDTEAEIEDVFEQVK